MASCAVSGGCPSDYIALSISILSFILLLAKWLMPYLIHKVSRPKGSSFWLVALQVFASFNLLLSILMALNFMKFKKRQWWRSCYLWAVWIEGPLGFGLLLSSRIAQAYQLYYIFVKRRLPPVRSYTFLPLILLPWIAAAAFINIEKPVNYRCHMGTQWIIPVICLHGLYVITLLGFTGAICHVEFKFHELKELWRGILVSASSIGIWVVAYILNEIREDKEWLQVVSRFVLLFMTSILVLAFFSISITQPLISLLSLRKEDESVYGSMGHALGIPDGGLLGQREQTQVIDPNDPLEKLLLDRKFRRSFMAFADSCLAGESIHFYDEVQLHDKIPLDDPVRRIYMARHIVEKYIVAGKFACLIGVKAVIIGSTSFSAFSIATFGNTLLSCLLAHFNISPNNILYLFARVGATMEVNISHRTRQEILTTADLAQPDLFKNALSELIQLMKMNLAKDYWSSTFFLKLKEESRRKIVGHELEQVAGWNYSPRLSSVHCDDDPFHQENSPADSGGNNQSSDRHCV